MRAPTITSGYSLTEIFVALGITLVLLSFVLLLFNHSQKQSQDAVIKSSLDLFKNLAQVHYESNNGSYQNLDTCFSDSTSNTCKGDVGSSLESLRRALQRTGTTPHLFVSQGQAYCFYAALQTDTAKTVCTDARTKIIVDGRCCAQAGRPKSMYSCTPKVLEGECE